MNQQKYFLIKNNQIKVQENKSMIFLISHDDSNTGAPNALINVKNYLDRFYINNTLLCIKDNDVISIIKNFKYNSITICNSIATYNILKNLFNISQTKIYWYIHEWIDEYSEKNITTKFNSFTDIEFKKINFIFICNKSLENYKKYYPSIKKFKIIFNSYNINIIEKKN